MTAQTAAGTKLVIGTNPPATFDAAGFAALTLTAVGKVEKLGAFGVTFGKTEFQPLDGSKEKYKGPPDSGAIQASMALDSADAGQALLQTAGADKTQKLYPVGVIYPDGAKRFFMSRVFGMPETADGAGSMLMANPSIEICTDIVKVPAPTS